MSNPCCSFCGSPLPANAPRWGGVCFACERGVAEADVPYVSCEKCGTGEVFDSPDGLALCDSCRLADGAPASLRYDYATLLLHGDDECGPWCPICEEQDALAQAAQEEARDEAEREEDEYQEHEAGECPPHCHYCPPVCDEDAWGDYMPPAYTGDEWED